MTFVKGATILLHKKANELKLSGLVVTRCDEIGLSEGGREGWDPSKRGCGDDRQQWGWHCLERERGVRCRARVLFALDDCHVQSVQESTRRDAGRLEATVGKEKRSTKSWRQISSVGLLNCLCRQKEKAVFLTTQIKRGSDRKREGVMIRLFFLC